MKYSIKINKTSRYIDWVDDCWYETFHEPLYRFTREQCDDIFKLLNGHYVYEVTLEAQDGTTEILNRFQKNIVRLSKNGIPSKIKICEEKIGEPKKKSIFKLSSLRLHRNA